ncbi:hypothetical protein MCEMSE15_03103 [Fimbriimonadaceae bacterium]
MGFFVIADDGNKYGPADLATLNAWIAEGRLQPNTILEEVQTMERRPASTVPGLNFPGAPGPQAARTYANPTAGPNIGQPNVGQPGGYSYQPGNYGMSGMGGGISAEATSELNKAWMCAVVGFLCCGFLPIYGIICANKAESLGHPQGKTAKIVNIVILVLICGGAVAGGLLQSVIR